MATIHNITRINTYNTTERVSHNTVTASNHTGRYNSNQNQAQVSTSQSYAEYQAAVKTLMQSHGFNADQAFKLSQISNLPIRQFSRAVVIAHLLMSDAHLFDQFVKTLKTILARGKHTQEAVKNFLDSLDQIWGKDSKNLAQSMMNQQQKVESALDKNYSQNSKQFSHELQHNLLKNMDFKNLPDAKALTPQLKEAFQKYMDFFNSSLDEFPTRFNIDAFAQSQLQKKGLSLQNYLKLSSEVPPLRLLNLLMQAEKNGHAPQGILNHLLAAQSRGENLVEILKALEAQYGVTNPFQSSFFENPFSNSSPNVLQNIFSSPLTLQEGDQIILSLLGFDVFDGLIASEKSGFVIYPPRAEFPGCQLNLSLLPPGVFFVMFGALNSKNKLMNYWMKVIVERKKQNAEQQQQQQNPESQKEKKEQQDEDSNLLQQVPPDLEAVLNHTSDEKIKEQSSPSALGPFLGEIVLPLDMIHAEASDCYVISSESGIVISEDEFYNGTFQHNAITFRFLAKFTQEPDLNKRHQLLQLKPSQLFQKFNDVVKEFIKDPKNKIEVFQTSLEDFFSELGNLFTQGKKTFEIAKTVFLEEAKAFVQGETGGEQYEAHSFEGDANEFLSACYAKGSYALAAAGDINGALNGLSLACVANLNDQQHKAQLGEYLRNLKDLYYTKTTEKELQNFYEANLEHALDESHTVQAYDKELGESFIEAVDVRL